MFEILVEENPSMNGKTFLAWANVTKKFLTDVK